MRDGFDDNFANTFLTLMPPQKRKQVGGGMAAARKYKNRAKRKSVLKGRKRSGNKDQGSEAFGKGKNKPTSFVRKVQHARHRSR
jgi:hypothetical protein